MIDIKAIRQDPDRFKRAAVNKRVNCDVDALCALDDRRRALQQELDSLKHQQNEISGQIAHYKNPKSRWFQQRSRRAGPRRRSGPRARSSLPRWPPSRAG